MMVSREQIKSGCDPPPAHGLLTTKIPIPAWQPPPARARRAESQIPG